MDLNQIDWAEKSQSDPNAVILDVRTIEEVNDGMIPGAIHHDIYKGQSFIYAIDELDREKTYYVYCKAGGRSAQACNIMQQMGFTNTHNLIGGFMQWQGEVAYPD